MKAVFFFYLNSLELSLVLTQTRQPYFAPFTTDCKLTKAGHEYAGPLNVTQLGRSCQRWNSDQPHFNYYKENPLFPEGSASAAGNKCRNPDSNYNVGVWCYTTSPNVRWELCNVGFCECRLQNDLLGIRYEGQIRYTRSGRLCRFWSYQTPKPHPFNQSIFYPDASVAEARNYCRNPNASRSDGPWCFTNDPNIEWEYCLIPVCNFTSPTFPTTPQTSTTSSQTSSTPTRTSTPRTTQSSTMDTRSMPPSPTNPRTMPMSTTNLMTIQPIPMPTTTRRSPSTKLSTRAVGLATQLPQDSPSSTRENASTNIVKIVIPIVVVIAVICIIVAIIVWKRTGLFQSSWKRFIDGRSPPSAERNQQRSTAAVTVDATPRQTDSFDNPVYSKDQQPIEISGVTKDHSSTDSVTITDSGVAYMSMDNVRLS